jgi:hypothetical protein
MAQHREYVFVAGCENRFAFYNTPNNTPKQSCHAMSGQPLNG